ncbi:MULTISPECIES: threonine-phosphate decarboxylase CobD [Halomonadaceae]|uniref:threonine-phosphate decarboxylase n=1 Tax=Vreelandella halophila TaxID=86177 RepID=A0A9X4YAE0_9GAMM|nr:MULTISPECIES: threonine-phosphate decarboxylase CobD [Halomonas]MYL26257.1 threonine-phosphate decarboxylase [Halomonas utahensis]MYL73181.1 threonine-phosphate decarboxylase [Halomonas sp. 22501_18_FS]
MATHGGRLNQAVQQWGIPRGQWVDLSTGINPWPWPVPAVPAEVWQRLPEEDDGLPAQARHWAGAPPDAGCLPVAGTQAAIQALPRLRAPGRIGVPDPGYVEHAEGWRAAGHEVIPFTTLPSDEELAALDALVWINPNNPTGEPVMARDLVACHEQLAAHGGWLVVDEAFIDAEPTQTLVPETGREGLVVYRSMGKFFGLAGLRAGLVFGPGGLCGSLGELLGPWAVSHPARYLTQQALSDTAWQKAAASQLHHGHDRLVALLRSAGLAPRGSAPYFAYCPHDEPGRVAEALAAQAVLVRVFEAPPALRFGLPGAEPEWEQLARALQTL